MIGQDLTRIWQDLADPEIVCQYLLESLLAHVMCQNLIDLTESVKISQDLVGSDTIWQDLAGSGRIKQDLAESGSI